MITGLSIWNLAEVQIGIIAACGPTLRQILAHIMPSSESVKSLISRMGFSQPSRKVSSEMPSFVKMADHSAEYLNHPGQVAVKNSTEHGGVDRYYEMDVRSGTERTVNQVNLEYSREGV